jgi:hypothetical protein
VGLVGRGRRAEIQMAEGFEPVSAVADSTPAARSTGFFWADCMKLKRVEAPCRITYRGRWDVGAVPEENGWA